jgi:hypothetical protein
MTVYMPQNYENILSMEKFKGLLKSVSCTNSSMTLEFKDDPKFAYAQRVWDWVNGADNHTFVMVAGAGDCGWNDARQPFVVSSITYDEAKNIAYLKAVAEEWEDIAHTYDLTVGHVDSGEIRKRISAHKGFSIPITKTFPWSVKHDVEGGSLEVACSGCQLNGHYHFEFGVSVGLTGLKSAYAKVYPQQVYAHVPLQFTLNADIKAKKDFPAPSLEIPLESLHIPKVLQIGPVLNIQPGFQLGPLKGSATLTGGWDVSLSDSAILELDLADSTNNHFSGWSPQSSGLPWAVDAKISAEAAVYIKATVDIQAEALKSKSGLWITQSA